MELHEWSLIRVTKLGAASKAPFRTGTRVTTMGSLNDTAG